MFPTTRRTIFISTPQESDVSDCETGLFYLHPIKKHYRTQKKDLVLHRRDRGLDGFTDQDLGRLGQIEEYKVKGPTAKNSLRLFGMASQPDERWTSFGAGTGWLNIRTVTGSFGQSVSSQ